MANVAVGSNPSNAFNYLLVDIGVLTGWTLTTATATTYRRTDPANVSIYDQFTGSGLTYSGGMLTGGTVTGWTRSGPLAAGGDFTITGFSLPAATLQSLLDSGDTNALFAAILGGADSLTGFAANDVMNGYDGDDTLVGNNGSDTLIGGQGNDSIAGGGGSDDLAGGAGDDILDGGAGIDSMAGGIGNDKYYVSAAGDVVTEVSGEGSADEVYSDVTLTLAANVENLYLQLAATTGTGNALDNQITDLTGSANSSLDGAGGNDTLYGNEGLDTLIGGTGNDSLVGGIAIDSLAGGAGNDTLNGGSEADSMAGGQDDDLYVVNAAANVVQELVGDGNDTLRAAVDYTLADNVERLELIGAAAIGTGNAAGNVIVGNSAASTLLGMGGNDTLTGLAGIDTIDGGAGADSLTGGGGNDKFVITAGEAAGDVIVDFTGNGASAGDSFTFQGYGAGATLSFISGTQYKVSDGVFNETITIVGAVDASDINIIYVPFTEPVTGTAGADSLDGTVGADTLGGGAGNDTINGDLGNDELYGGNDHDQINGGDGNDKLFGGVGDLGIDTLDGGLGIDTMTGGAGNDTYVIDNVGDKTVEISGGGSDTVQSSVNITLEAEVEILVLTGAANLLGTGNALANTLTGNSGANTLDGGVGADTMTGGGGNDTYVVDDAGDKVIESAAGGTDTVQTSISHILSSEVENLALTGSAAIAGTGNGLANTLTGNSGANALDGGVGADTMTGGGGNDTYIVDDIGDKTIEGAAGGTDTVQTAAAHTLGGEIENLVLTGGADVAGTGNGLINSLTGNGGANTLDGGLGADTMSGGAGNDVYVVDNIGDKTVELAGGGTDTVQSSVSITLEAEIEVLTLTGAGNIAGTGNALANSLTGNGGANTLDGGLGADTMSGGLGNDTYAVDDVGDKVIESAGGGTDAVQSSIACTLTADVENLTLTGSGNVTGTGNGLANILTGNSGVNLLDGGAGADTMTGGAGNDTYVVDDVGDKIIESAAGGTDTVQIGSNYVLGSEVENLILTGAANVTGTGNGLANSLTGNGGANTLDGGLGADTMIGGAGNDVYVIDNVDDFVTELAGGGADTVQSAVGVTLGGEVEALILTGIANIAGSGNGLANTLTGNAGANTLDGGAGADTMTGGAGNDLYVVDNAGDKIVEIAGGGGDTVQSGVTIALDSEIETLVLTGGGSIAGTGNGLANAITGNGGDNTLDGAAGADTLTGGGGNDLFVITAGTGNGDVIADFAGNGAALGDSIQFTGYGAGATLTSLGSNKYLISGNGFADTITIVGVVNAADHNALSAGAEPITGTTGADVLAGTTGNDTLGGGAGNDTVNGNDGTDLLFGGDGNDAINGGAGDDVLSGGAGNDTLDGGTGNDGMSGGAGNDNYVVDSATDSVIEDATGGTDSVQSSVSFDLNTIGANVENLILVGAAATGTGNGFNNSITGNDVANNLTGHAGNDSILGGLGDDVIDGGVGLDTLGGGDGNDSVTGGTEADKLNGDAGNDTLDGGAGVDTAVGGLGDDVYRVDSATDVATELADEGFDIVQASADYVLKDHLERLELSGAAVAGTGNTLNNVIVTTGGAAKLTGLEGRDSLTGGAGNDSLHGGADGDSLTGGSGDDLFVVKAGQADGDVIADFTGNGAAAGDSILFEGYAADTVLQSLGANLYLISGTTFDEVITIVGALDATDHNLGAAAVEPVTGTAGNDTLNGAAGNDTHGGGLGDDVVTGLGGNDRLFGGAGNDTVDGGIGNDRLFGSAGNDSLIGGDGNDTLDGSAGIDNMAGNNGNDVYVVNVAGETITEAAAQGTDLVKSLVDFTLGLNIENLALIGGAINGVGNTLNNVITGSGANNILSGLDGNDTINGGLGNDTLDGGLGTDAMVGGAGNDVYLLDGTKDIVTETALSGSGIDEVRIGATYTLGTNVENLLLAGATAINGTGNTLKNVITGNDGANKLLGMTADDSLNGGLGNDTLDGGAGADSMIGGAGDDVYIIDDLDKDGTGVDRGDVIVETGGAANGIDTIQTPFAVDLGVQYPDIENATLTGTAAVNAVGSAAANWLIGNSGANQLTGLAGNDKLNGGVGADTLTGGGNDDTYYVDNAGDKVIELAADGIDTVESTITYVLGAELENLTLLGTTAINGTGNGLANILTGNGGANVLDGGVGADSMIGGAGNDTYIVDDAGDKVTEAAAGGTDTVKSSITHGLAAEAENLVLTGVAVINGTGNGLANTLTGNVGVNILDGGLGADTMIGGGGNDTYVVDNIGDKVTEVAAGGTDSVQASVSHALAVEVEHLVLTGGGHIAGTGNALANTLTGNAGNNTLNGGVGADTMIGGAGDDVFIVDNLDTDGGGVDLGDIVTETGGTANGIDRIETPFAIDLGVQYPDVENATLTGTAAVNAIGSNVANALVGNSGANVLSGLGGDDLLRGAGGNDTLTGGAGSDTFWRAASTDGKDTVVDFTAGVGGDKLDIGDLLVGYVAGTSDPNAFVQLVASGADTILRIDANGAVGGAVFTDAFLLSGIAPPTVSQLIADGNLIMT